MATDIPPPPGKRSVRRLNRLVFTLFFAALGLTLVIYLVPWSNFTGTNTEPKRVYFAENITPAHQEMINRFNDLHKGEIEVIPVNLPFAKFTTNERKELIVRSLRSRSSRIDIFAVDQIWVSRFAKWAIPLAPYFPQRILDNFLPAALETCYANESESLVALPLFIDLGVLLYRSDMLAKLPNSSNWTAKVQESITWDDMIDLKQHYFQGQDIFAFQGDAYEGTICDFVEILGGRGVFLGPDLPRELVRPEVIDGLQFMIDLIYKYHLASPQVVSFNENLSCEYAVNHDVPFIRGWPTSPQNINWAGIQLRKVKNLQIAPLPHTSGFKPTPVFGGWNLMISRHSPVKPEAMAFLKFAISTEGQQILLNTGSLLPILKEFYEFDQLADQRYNLSYYYQQMQNGIHRPRHPNYTAISDVLSKFINKALLQEMTAAAALTQSAVNIKPLMTTISPGTETQRDRHGFDP